MSRWSSHDAPRGDDYDARWRRLAAQGVDPHGEADLVCRYAPRRVLDAGCGTGRVGIELAARGVDVVGVDLDPAMLATARAKAPHIRWIEADLVDVVVDGDPFDVVVMAGNVVIFVAPGTEAAVVARCAAHLRPGGRLVAGFQLHPGGYGIERYDDAAAAAGLSLEDRFATWEGAPYEGGPYAVSVHQLVTGAG